MTGLPNLSNLHGTLETLMSKTDIAALFSRQGWSTRRCGHDEWEFTAEYAELVLEGEAPVLLHGTVANVRSNASRIATLLRDAYIAFSLEAYDGETLLERSRTRRTRIDSLPAHRAGAA